MSECIEWHGSKDRNGYGKRTVGSRTDGTRRNVLAHRYAMGEPDGLVLHHCDNPSCINPDHLYVGTQSDNMHDMHNRGRHGTPIGEGHALSKLTEAHVHLIRASDKTTAQLARDLNVSEYAVYAVRAGKTWKHIP